MPQEPKVPKGILSWSEEDRPREKLLLKGKQALSDAELIAILLGSGTPDRSAVEVAKDLLKQVEHDLEKLGQLTIKQLCKPKGIGPAKAITIAASMELGRRRKTSEKRKRLKITSSKDAYDYMYPLLADLEMEQFYVLLLRRSNEVIRHHHVSTGGVSGTVVDPKIIFRPALEELACSIVLCHNHPSGNIKPSQADISLTNKLKQAGDVLDIRLIDHIIFTNNDYTSFADEGML
ncbi:MAG: DNA repair protein RadC [Bacteroidia bacterium]